MDLFFICLLVILVFFTIWINIFDFLLVSLSWTFLNWLYFQYPNNLYLLTGWGDWKVKGKTELWFHFSISGIASVFSFIRMNPSSSQSIVSLFVVFLSCLCKLPAAPLGLISPSVLDMKQNRRQLFGWQVKCFERKG